MAFSHRRQLHLLVAEAIQTHTDEYFADNDETEGNILIYHWYLSE